MVRDYTEQLYEPTAAQGDELGADHHAKARTLAAWKQKVAAGWPGVHVDQVEVDDAVAEIGMQRRVTAVVSLGDLSPDDVEVQLLHGPSGQGDELSSPTIVPLAQGEPAEDGHVRYTGSFACETAGRYGITVRVVPSHDALETPVELGLIAIAT